MGSLAGANRTWRAPPLESRLLIFKEGEPSVDPEALVAVVDAAVGAGLHLDYVEANASWFTDPAPQNSTASNGAMPSNSAANTSVCPVLKTGHEADRGCGPRLHAPHLRLQEIGLFGSPLSLEAHAIIGPMFDLYESPRVSTIATLSRGLWRAAAALASAGTLVTLAARAQAQPLGAAEVFAITGEELTGFTTESSKWDDINEDQNTYNTSRFNLALSNGARIGVHYFYWSQVSLGGTLGFASEDGSSDVPDGGGTFSNDRQADTTVWVLPKIGYLLPVTPKAGFWFRGGPGLRRTHVHPQRYNAWQQTETHWLLEADALFVFAPVPVVGLLVGPVGDFGIVGYHTEKNIGDANPNHFSHPASYYRFGIWAGLVVMLW